MTTTQTLQRDRFDGLMWRGHLRQIGPREFRSCYRLRTTDGTLDGIEVTQADDKSGWELRAFGTTTHHRTKSDAQVAAKALV